jgi:ankyrin repeat protein
MKDGFAWACEFGQTSVVDFLLQNGMGADAKLKHHGQTGLHWAAFGGHAAIVKLLLEFGAVVDIRDDRFCGTPLGWALYAWGDSKKKDAGRYREVVALLVRAGAKLDPDWYEDDPQRERAIKKMRSDPGMMAALGGEISKIAKH